MKPSEYVLQYAVLQETNYTCAEPEGDGHLPKIGVLQPGRVVWLQHEPGAEEQSTRAFAQGIGVVDMDTHLLHRVAPLSPNA